MDELYEQVIALGATGGKLLGAGGGGFFLFHAPAGVRERVESELDSAHRIIPLEIDRDGSIIIFDDDSRL